MLSLLGPTLSPSHLLAQTPGGTAASEALTRRAAARLRALRDEADELARRERGILGELRQLEVARQIANEEVRQADAAVLEAAAQTETIDSQVQGLERQRDGDRPKLASRLVEMYKLGRGRYLRLLLSASDVGRLGQASRTVAALADRDEDRIRTYERRLTELATARRAVDVLRQDLTVKRAAAARAQAAAARAIAEQNALVREIDRRRDLNAQLASELQAAQQKLETTLTDVGAANAMPALPIGPFRGALPWPVTGLVQRRATGPTAPATARRPGVEIQATEGTSVQAVHDGVVAYAGSFEGLGNLVIIDHGGQTFTLYGHLLEITVGQGVHLNERQPVGRVGASPTGSPTLYFELRVGGRPVDPLQWLERAR